MPRIIFIERSGNKREVDAEIGQTLLQVAWNNKLEVEGACGGSMACSTCHMIVDADWVKKLPLPSDDETDMLDLAYGVTKYSRLGCQIKVTQDLDGLIVKLPAMTKSLL